MTEFKLSDVMPKKTYSPKPEDIPPVEKTETPQGDDKVDVKPVPTDVETPAAGERDEVDPTIAWANMQERENLRLRQQLEQYKRELDEVKTGTPTRRTAPTKEERQAQLKKALSDIDQLAEEDLEPEDYAAKRAEILAEVFYTPSTVDELTISEIIRKEFEQREALEQQRVSQESLMTKAELLAANSGLSMKKGSRDHTMFWDALNRAPVGEGVTLENQVEYMVNEVKRWKEDYRKEILSQATDREREVLMRTPLGEGSVSRPRTTPEEDNLEPYTIGSILSKNRKVWKR